MKQLLITLCMTFALAAAEPPKSDPKPPAGVPADAVKVGDSTWRHIDSKGKAWLYMRTPFGFSRMEEKPRTEGEQARSKDKVAAPAFRVAAVKDGVITFERDTPFGKNKWTRKRAELSADEQAALSAFESAASPTQKQPALKQ